MPEQPGPVGDAERRGRWYLVFLLGRVLLFVIYLASLPSQWWQQGSSWLMARLRAFADTPVGKVVLRVLQWLGGLILVLRRCIVSFVTLLIVAVVFTSLDQGRDLLQDLLDSESAWSWEVRFFIASALFCAFSVWYWARLSVQLRVDNPRRPDPLTPVDGSDPTRWLRTWVPRILGTGILAALSLAFFLAWRTYPTNAVAGRLMWAWMFSLVGAVVFFVGVWKRRSWVGRAMRTVLRFFETCFASPSERYTLSTLPASSQWIISLVAVGWIVGLFAVWVRPTSASSIGTAPVLFFALSAWCLAGAIAVYLRDRFRVPVLSLLVVTAVVFGSWNDNHPVVAVDDLQPRDRIDAAFNAWYAGIEQRQVFVVAVEGAGIRAGYWTGLVLADLQDREPAFARQTFAASTVSGGTLGAVVFRGLLNKSEEPRCRAEGGLRGCVQRYFADDFLAPAIAMTVGPDLVARFSPLALESADRSRGLEESWTKAWHATVDTLTDGTVSPDSTFERSFADLWRGADTSLLPVLLLNSTHVETGRPVSLAPVTWAGLPEMNVIGSLADTLGGHPPVDGAIHNTARFPYVSPAGTVRPSDQEPWGHIVDGGYFENSGLDNLLAMLRALDAAARADGREPIEWNVIYLRSAVYRERFEGDADFDDAEAHSRFVGLMSPIRTYLQTRISRPEAAVAATRAYVGDDRFFELRLCVRNNDGSEPPPILGWSMSERARRVVDTQLDDGCFRSPNDEVVSAIIDRVRGLDPPPPPPIP